MSARSRLVPLEDKSGWREALNGVPHGFAHTWECCDAIHASREHPTFLYVYEDGPVRVVGPFVERLWDGSKDVTTPFSFCGFVSNGDAPGFRQHWREFARQRGYVCAYGALHPTLDRPDLHGQTYTSNTLYVMNLAPGPEALLAQVNRERRRIVRRWKESGRSFCSDRERLSAFVVSQHEAFMRSVGASGSALLSRETLTRFCAAPQLHIEGVEDDGELVAVHAFAATPWDAECLFFLAQPAGRKYMPVLTWAAIERCCTLGLPHLNLGGGVRPDDSIAFAKKLLAPMEIPLRSTKEIFDAEAYQALCLRAGVDPADLTGYFPAYRAGWSAG